MQIVFPAGGRFLLQICKLSANRPLVPPSSPTRRKRNLGAHIPNFHGFRPTQRAGRKCGSRLSRKGKLRRSQKSLTFANCDRNDANLGGVSRSTERGTESSPFHARLPDFFDPKRVEKCGSASEPQGKVAPHVGDTGRGAGEVTSPARSLRSSRFPRSPSSPRG